MRTPEQLRTVLHPNPEHAGKRMFEELSNASMKHQEVIAVFGSLLAKNHTEFGLAVIRLWLHEEKVKWELRNADAAVFSALDFWGFEAVLKKSEKALNNQAGTPNQRAWVKAIENGLITKVIFVPGYDDDDHNTIDILGAAMKAGIEIDYTDPERRLPS